MSITSRPTSAELCEFTDPETADPGRAYSAPITTSCEAPAGLTVGDDIEAAFDASGNPVFGESPETDETVVIDTSIDSLEDLAAVVTTTITVGTASAIKMFIEDATGTTQVWQLIASTAAHDPLNGVVRPSDFNSLTNAKVWFLRPAA